MPTLASIADDICVAMSYTHDDALHSRVGVMYNVKLAIDKVQDQILTKAIKSRDMMSVNNMLTLFPAVEVTNHTADDTSDWDYHAFILPAEIYSLPNDGGIALIRYHRNGLPQNCPPQIARATFTETTLASLSALYASPQLAPAADQPYFVPVKELVLLYGVDPSIATLTVGLFATVPAFDSVDMDPNQEVTLPSEYLMAVKKLVMDMERWMFQIPQQQLKNDGRALEPNQVVRTEPLLSRNDPLQLEN